MRAVNPNFKEVIKMKKAIISTSCVFNTKADVEAYKALDWREVPRTI